VCGASFSLWLKPRWQYHQSQMRLVLAYCNKQSTTFIISFVKLLLVSHFKAPHTFICKVATCYCSYFNNLDPQPTVSHTLKLHDPLFTAAGMMRMLNPWIVNFFHLTDAVIDRLIFNTVYWHFPLITVRACWRWEGRGVCVGGGGRTISSVHISFSI
jgi:hypothetical protein